MAMDKSSRNDFTERLAQAYEENISYIRENMSDLPTADQILTGIAEVTRKLEPDEEMLLAEDLVYELNLDNVLFSYRCDRFLNFISQHFRPEIALLTLKEFIETEKGQVFVKNHLHSSDGWKTFTARIPLASEIFHIFVAGGHPTL